MSLSFVEAQQTHHLDLDEILGLVPATKPSSVIYKLPVQLRSLNIVERIIMSQTFDNRHVFFLTGGSSKPIFGWHSLLDDETASYMQLMIYLKHRNKSFGDSFHDLQKHFSSIPDCACDFEDNDRSITNPITIVACGHFTTDQKQIISSTFTVDIDRCNVALAWSKNREKLFTKITSEKCAKPGCQSSIIFHNDKIATSADRATETKICVTQNHYDHFILPQCCGASFFREFLGI